MTADLLHAAQALLDNDAGFAPEIAEYSAAPCDQARLAIGRRLWRSQALILDMAAALYHEPQEIPAAIDSRQEREP